MKGTFNVNGHKVRVASQRRYILVRFSDYDGRYHIVRRSDTLATLANLRNRENVIIDTATGETR
jgi:hypothetical protein